MSKPVFGLLLGGFLGIFDGLSALLSAPETAPQIVGIVIKGVITGLIIGLVARKTRSLALAVVVGGLVGLALAFPIALMNRYYWQIMLPGGVLGVIVGYATFRHGAATAVAAHQGTTMKTMTLAALTLAIAAPAWAQAPTPSASPAPAASPAAAKADEPPPEMMTYYFVMLVKGPKWTGQSNPDLMKQHLAHLRSMWAAGKMVIAGPLLDDGATRGLCIYKVSSIEEARALAGDDPAVKAGRLAVEVHPWMVQKGILP